MFIRGIPSNNIIYNVRKDKFIKPNRIYIFYFYIGNYFRRNKLFANSLNDVCVNGPFLVYPLIPFR